MALLVMFVFFFFFFNDTATTEIYTLSLHDALPISWEKSRRGSAARPAGRSAPACRGCRRGRCRRSCRVLGQPRGRCGERLEALPHQLHSGVHRAVPCEPAGAQVFDARGPHFRHGGDPTRDARALVERQGERGTQPVRAPARDGDRIAHRRDPGGVARGFGRRRERVQVRDQEAQVRADAASLVVVEQVHAHKKTPAVGETVGVISHEGGSGRTPSPAAKIPEPSPALYRLLPPIFYPMPRLAIAQIRPSKGDYAANLQKIGGVLAQIAKPDPPLHLVIFPATVTSGYFVEGGVPDVAVTAGTVFRDLTWEHEAASAPPIDVAVGFYEVFQNHFYNSCLYASLGNAPSDSASPRNASSGHASPGIRHVHRKVFLPTYGVFDEERFVERGRDIQAFDTRFGRVAMLICEDAWHSITGTIAALQGAQLVIVPSASPARGTGMDEEGTRLPTSVVRWERILKGIAAEPGVWVAFASLVGFEGGKGFPGGSVLVSPGGEIVLRGPLFEEAVLTYDLDFEELTRARAESPLLANLEGNLPLLIKNLGKGERGKGKGKARAAEFDPATNGASVKSAIRNPQSAIHLVGKGVEEGDPLAIDPDLARRWLTSFLKDEVVRRRGFTKGIVGLSGGVDSSLTAFLAVEALGKQNVIAVRMPYKTSSPESLQHAQLVIDQLGIEALTIDISAAVDGYLSQVETNGAADPTRRGNVMARERMIVLFDLSAKYKALPIGTSNKSERLLGYFTWHADDTPPVNPLGDLFKTQVRALARHVGVPDVILRKPPTPDLVPGQTTEGDYGISYDKVDRILYYLIRGMKPEDIVSRGFTREEVDKVERRLESTHWKRRLPTVAVMSQTAIGEFYLRPVDY